MLSILRQDCDPHYYEILNLKKIVGVLSILRQDCDECHARRKLPVVCRSAIHFKAGLRLSLLFRLEKIPTVGVLSILRQDCDPIVRLL